jgi:hypothetical protein
MKLRLICNLCNNPMKFGIFARIETECKRALFINTRLQPVLKASNAEAFSTAFLQGKTVETVCRFDRCIHRA